MWESSNALKFLTNNSKSVSSGPDNDVSSNVIEGLNNSHKGIICRWLPYVESQTYNVHSTVDNKNRPKNKTTYFYGAFLSVRISEKRKYISTCLYRMVALPEWFTLLIVSEEFNFPSKILYIIRVSGHFEGGVLSCRSMQRRPGWYAEGSCFT